MKIELEFDEQMTSAVMEGRKCCTLRMEPHGSAGDTFEVGGRTYRILQILQTQMWLAELDFCGAAGFGKPAELRDAYQKQHNLQKLDGEMTVFVHFFARVPEAPK